MDAQDKERFASNVAWFNRFFGDLKLLFERIAKALENEFSWSERGYYYPKSNYQPSIPAYYFMGLGGESFAVQVYAVLDPSLFENNPHFEKEPSLVVVKHSRGDRYLYDRDFGQRVIQNDGIELTERDNGVMIGKTKSNEPTSFYGFQVPFATFTIGQELEKAIQEAVVEMIRKAPNW